MSNPYITYLHQTTKPIAPLLTIVPREPQAATGSPVIKAARYLGTRQMRLPSGNYVEREMWTGAAYEFVGYIGDTYTRIRDRYGVLTLPRNQVRVLDNVLAEAA